MLKKIDLASTLTALPEPSSIIMKHHKTQIDLNLVRFNNLFPIQLHYINQKRHLIHFKQRTGNECLICYTIIHFHPANRDQLRASIKLNIRQIPPPICSNFQNY
jgi:hypothetical protein